MDALSELERHFLGFPGIGARQAKRFVEHLLKIREEDRAEIATLVAHLSSVAGNCRLCARFILRDRPDAPSICRACADPNRDPSLLIVVEKDADLEAIERAGVFQGRAFVLGGTIPFMTERPEEKVRLDALIHRIQSDPALKEIILASAMTPEGDHTREIIHMTLSPLLEGRAIRITRLGRGLSTGSELEYADADTLRFALEGRKEDE